MKPRLFEPRAAEQKYIRELIQLEDTLKQQRTQLKLQLSCVQSIGIKKEFEQTIELLDKRLKQLEIAIKSAITANPQWNKLIQLLISIKGFGLLSAYRF